MLRALINGVVALALAAGAAAQQRITINVACPQGIGEGRHTFSVTVENTHQQPPNTETVTVSMPEYLDSAAVAAALAAKFNSLFPHLCERVKIDEVDRPSGNRPGNGPPSKDDKLKRHDLILPSCLKFVSCAHARNGRPTATGQVTIEPAKERKTSSAAPVELRLDVRACDPGTVLAIGVFGSSVDPDQSTAEFALDYGASHPLADVGDWLRDNYGATVTYSSHTGLVAIIPPAADVSFCYASTGEIYQDDLPVTYVDTLEFDVTYSS
ncbi:MAG: hypothetical protein R3F56_25825 [Planctomycetota bacterium]